MHFYDIITAENVGARIPLIQYSRFQNPDKYQAALQVEKNWEFIMGSNGAAPLVLTFTLPRKPCLYTQELNYRSEL